MTAFANALMLEVMYMQWNAITNGSRTVFMNRLRGVMLS